MPHPIPSRAPAAVGALVRRPRRTEARPLAELSDFQPAEVSDFGPALTASASLCANAAGDRRRHDPSALRGRTRHVQLRSLRSALAALGWLALPGRTRN